MQNQALNAYQQVAKKTATPRDLESSLLSRSATNLQRIRDNWSESRGNLSDALMFNRRLWTVFLSSVTRDDHPLPREIRENVANLGIFIMKHQLDIEATPEARKLDVLININRELANGLRAAAAA